MIKKKSLLIVVALIISAILATILLLVQNLDRLVAAGIEKYGSEEAGTPVRVQSVKIDLREGRGTITGLSVTNPPGFTGKPVFILGEITLDLDTGTLTSEVPVIEDIRIGQTNFRYEINAQGQSNVAALKNNLKQGSAPAAEPSSPGGEGAPLRLKINRLAMAGGGASLDLSAVGGKDLQAEVPGFILTDIGGNRGVTPENLANVVLAALLKELEKAAARQGVEQVLRDKLGDRAVEAEQKIDEKLGTGASEKLKKMLGN
jgi:hypothetical protein